MAMASADVALVEECLASLAQTTSVAVMDVFPQHGSTSCLWHSVGVAYYSLRLAAALHLRCDRRSMVRGALLHDYFLYDWHLPQVYTRVHGYAHPRIALSNAMRECRLNKIEGDVILRHMFPLTPIPPVYREAMLVCIVDKACSLLETFSSRDRYRRLQAHCREAVLASPRAPKLREYNNMPLPSSKMFDWSDDEDFK